MKRGVIGSLLVFVSFCYEKSNEFVADHVGMTLDLSNLVFDFFCDTFKIDSELRIRE